MKGYIGYIRVSTVKQGTKGVSLQEQHDAITQYAARLQLPITTWLEEMETAAKRGRPVFCRAMKMLRKGSADGIILHKLDRGARNLKDWADLGELADRGVEVHFVNESIDLNSRGGRLSADIQAVVAADYIRNLREETRKGFLGRLKQGLYPLQAPIGYVDQGGGKAKTIDPVKGPLVRRAFELYATGQYNLEALGREMYKQGLRNRNGGRITRNGWSTILNNPFYIGVIRIDRMNETHDGIHQPLIAATLFDRVQATLKGKSCPKVRKHDFPFKRLLSCARCQFILTGERHKGYVYYRCHTKGCNAASIRGDVAEQIVKSFLESIALGDRKRELLRTGILELKRSWAQQVEKEAQAVRLKLGQIKDRLNRLTDAYLDNLLDKPMFEQRKESLIMEQKAAESHLTSLLDGQGGIANRLEAYLDMAESAWASHQSGNLDQRRELLRKLASTMQVDGKKLELQPSIPFGDILSRLTRPNREAQVTKEKLELSETAWLSQQMENCGQNGATPKNTELEKSVFRK